MQTGKKLMKKFTIVAVLALFCGQAIGSTVAIIDSGTDMEHPDIAPKAWVNSVDEPDNQRDEDGNGYPDDIHGWNFAGGNNDVIDYSYLGMLNERVRRFFKVQTKVMLGTATQDEVEWMREQINDEEFVEKLQTYANFMHGTHVAGIAARDFRQAEVLAVKLLPTEAKLPGQDLRMTPKKGAGTWLVKKGLAALAKEQSKILVEIGDYVGGHEADVANGSFGTGYRQAATIVKAIFENILQREPTEQEVKEVATYYIDELLGYVKDMATISEDTLFVFASGNDGTNNDELPTSPANIEAENALSVAATNGRRKLAGFSNFGEKTVDVAAPGVAIKSSVPGGEYLRVSGTSQAAPYVAKIAGKLKETNPELTPVQMKKILMGTVDVKEFLKGKVRSSGVVNGPRAVRAASLARGQELSSAISEANQSIDDVPTKVARKGLSLDIPKGMIQPLPSLLKIKK